MQKWYGIGNLTKDVDLATTQSGVKVAKFTLAVGRRFANANGEKETDFINIVVWRELAELCGKYLKKGNKCAVVGELQVRSYDAQDGTKRYVSEIIASEVEFLTPKQDNGQEASGNTAVELAPLDDDSDLPF